MGLRALEEELRNQKILSAEWHSALREYSEKLIELTKPIQEKIALEERRYNLGY